MEARDFDLSDPDAAAYCPSCGAAYTSEGGTCADCGVAVIPRAQISSKPAFTAAFTSTSWRRLWIERRSFSMS
jgi:hypothetical protein